MKITVSLDREEYNEIVDNYIAQKVGRPLKKAEPITRLSVEKVIHEYIVGELRKAIAADFLDWEVKSV